MAFLFGCHWTDAFVGFGTRTFLLQLHRLAMDGQNHETDLSQQTFPFLFSVEK